MTTTLKFKEYVGSVEPDLERGVLRGKILFISDLVTYEAESVRGLQHEFEMAVADYAETCAEIGKEPQKSFTGVFNVRIEPECHKALAMLAASDGRPLNGIISEAVHWYLNERNGGARKVEHLHKVVVEQQVSAGFATPSGALQWETHDARFH